MQVQRVQNHTNFTGKFVDNYALRKFIAGLDTLEADTFAKCVKDIEQVNDGKKFVYMPLLTGEMRVAKIHELNKNGEPIYPAKFANKEGKKPINVFEQMASWYKSYGKDIM